MGDISKSAVLIKSTVPIKLKPNFESEMADEGLYGNVVSIIEDLKDGWYYVKTHYNYYGYIHQSDMIMDDDIALKWDKEANNIITHLIVDVMVEASYKSYILVVLTKGSRVLLTGNSTDGWCEIELPDKKRGWVREAFVGDLIKTYDKADEKALRSKLVETALSYKGTQYRWGGKSSFGIDCSGLCSIAYLLNGIVIYRDAVLKVEYMRRIALDEIKPGDLLFFPGHVAMYIGDDKFVHSSSSINGVKINSLNPSHDDYKEDLAKTISGIGTIF